MYGVVKSARMQDDEQLAVMAGLQAQAGSEVSYECYVFENERKSIWGDWDAGHLASVERSNLSHGDGVGSYDWGSDGAVAANSRSPTMVPPVGWRWAEPWRCGDWEYARIWGLQFYAEDFFTATVRRRVWGRRCVFQNDVFDSWQASKVNLGQWMGSAVTAAGDDDKALGESAEGRAASLLEALREENYCLEGVDVPEELCCPLTMEPMVQPVVTADGHTYEQAAIAAWLEQHETSPLTNERLPHKNTIPNQLARTQLMALREKHQCNSL